jgi:hypothetical protein
MAEGAAGSEDNAYRAVGRYVVEFSRLIACQRLDIEKYLAIEGNLMVPALVLGAAPAEQITQSFFAVCEYVGELDEDERKVAGKLRVEVLDEIKRRNDFAHGDWLLGTMRETFVDPVLSRVKPGRRSGAIQKQAIPITDIESAADEVYVLRQKVAEFGALCFDTFPIGLGADGSFRVRHAFKVEGKQVIRINPAAVNFH